MKGSIFTLLVVVLLLSACSTIDCSLNNTVYANYVLRGSDSTLVDTLTVSGNRIDGTDSVLLNRLTATGTFSLPVSYSQNEDVLYFHFADTLGNVLTDTVRLAKDNQPHFEAVDCSPNYFHTLRGITSTHHVIDSLVINNPSVDYDASKQHIFVYLHPCH